MLASSRQSLIAVRQSALLSIFFAGSMVYGDLGWKNRILTVAGDEMYGCLRKTRILVVMLG